MKRVLCFLSISLFLSMADFGPVSEENTNHSNGSWRQWKHQRYSNVEEWIKKSWETTKIRLGSWWGFLGRVFYHVLNWKDIRKFLSKLNGWETTAYIAENPFNNSKMLHLILQFHVIVCMLREEPLLYWLFILFRRLFIRHDGQNKKLMPLIHDFLSFWIHRNKNFTWTIKMKNARWRYI